MKTEIPRAAMSAEERELRARAAQLLHGQGFVHGTLSERQVVCGNRKCKCARGDKHRALVLCVRRDGRYHQLHIPRSLEMTVRQWVNREHEIQDLLRRISEVHWDKLRELKTKGRPSSDGS